MGEDVIRLLDYLHIPRANLVGASMGATIAANIAARYPNRVASATLLAFGGVDSTAVMRTTAAIVRDLDAGRGLTGFLKFLEPGMDSAAAQNFSRRLMAANDSSSLRGVLLSLATLTAYLDHPPQLPVLIVAGGDDPLNPASHALASRWPNARLLELPTASHVNIITRPEVLEAIRQITRVP
jgi:pimeloyl-ACP methyl ester carboxylesterase